MLDLPPYFFVPSHSQCQYSGLQRDTRCRGLVKETISQLFLRLKRWFSRTPLNPQIQSWVEWQQSFSSKHDDSRNTEISQLLCQNLSTINFEILGERGCRSQVSRAHFKKSESALYVASVAKFIPSPVWELEWVVCATITNVDKQTLGCVTVWFTLNVISQLLYVIFTRRNHCNRTWHLSAHNVIARVFQRGWNGRRDGESSVGTTIKTGWEEQLVGSTITGWEEPGSGRSGDSGEAETGDRDERSTWCGTRIKDL